jgi:molybdopterin converting factor small subunit
VRRQENMGKIEVRLYANLRDYYPEIGRDGVLTLPLDDHIKVGKLLSKLKAPRKEIAMVMVNGRHVKEDHVLQDGDRVGLFPLIGGG